MFLRDFVSFFIFVFLVIGVFFFYDYVFSVKSEEALGTAIPFEKWANGFKKSFAEKKGMTVEEVDTKLAGIAEKINAYYKKERENSSNSTATN